MRAAPQTTRRARASADVARARAWRVERRDALRLRRVPRRRQLRQLGVRGGGGEGRAQLGRRRDAARRKSNGRLLLRFVRLAQRTHLAGLQPKSACLCSAARLRERRAAQQQQRSHDEGMERGDAICNNVCHVSMMPSLAPPSASRLA
jgi:hypothetical protein